MPYRNRGAVLNFALLFEMIHKQLANSHTARFKLGQLPLKFCAFPNKEAANSGGLTPAIFENGCSLYNGWLRPMELFAYRNCMFASCLQFLKPVVIFLGPLRGGDILQPLMILTPFSSWDGEGICAVPFCSLGKFGHSRFKLGHRWCGFAGLTLRRSFGFTFGRNKNSERL
jgi:hypothetical protein